MFGAYEYAKLKTKKPLNFRQSGEIVAEKLQFGWSIILTKILDSSTSALLEHRELIKNLYKLHTLGLKNDEDDKSIADSGNNLDIT